MEEKMDMELCEEAEASTVHSNKGAISIEVILILVVLIPDTFCRNSVNAGPGADQDLDGV